MQRERPGVARRRNASAAIEDAAVTAMRRDPDRVTALQFAVLQVVHRDIPIAIDCDAEHHPVEPGQIRFEQRRIALFGEHRVPRHELVAAVRFRLAAASIGQSFPNRITIVRNTGHKSRGRYR